jgi:hypothetical protein
MDKLRALQMVREQYEHERAMKRANLEALVRDISAGHDDQLATVSHTSFSLLLHHVSVCRYLSCHCADNIMN